MQQLGPGQIVVTLPLLSPRVAVNKSFVFAAVRSSVTTFLREYAYYGTSVSPQSPVELQGASTHDPPRSSRDSVCFSAEQPEGPLNVASLLHVWAPESARLYVGPREAERARAVAEALFEMSPFLLPKGVYFPTLSMASEDTLKYLDTHTLYVILPRSSNLLRQKSSDVDLLDGAVNLFVTRVGPLTRVQTTPLTPRKVGAFELLNESWFLFKRAPQFGRKKKGVGIGLVWSEAAITVNENCDPTARYDLETAFDRLSSRVPKNLRPLFRTQLIGQQVSLPVGERGLRLGTWQGLHTSWVPYATGGQNPLMVAAELIESNAHNKITSVTLKFRTRARSCLRIDDRVQKAITDHGAKGKSEGLVLVFIKHTSASLAVIPHEEHLVFEKRLSDLVPETWNQHFQHTYEGADDMPAHVKASLVGASVLVPLRQGSVEVGVAQGIYLCEHRQSHDRTVEVVVIKAEL